MIADLEATNPGCVENIFHSIQNVSPSQLGDANLFDFSGLAIDRSTARPEHKFGGIEVSSCGTAKIDFQAFNASRFVKLPDGSEAPF